VFTARYALSPHIKQMRFVFKVLKHLFLDTVSSMLTFFWSAQTLRHMNTQINSFYLNTTGTLNSTDTQNLYIITHYARLWYKFIVHKLHGFFVIAHNSAAYWQLYWGWASDRYYKFRTWTKRIHHTCCLYSNNTVTIWNRTSINLPFLFINTKIRHIFSFTCYEVVSIYTFLMKKRDNLSLHWNCFPYIFSVLNEINMYIKNISHLSIVWLEQFANYKETSGT
jgi:hypothetical protein